MPYRNGADLVRIAVECNHRDRVVRSTRHIQPTRIIVEGKRRRARAWEALERIALRFQSVAANRYAREHLVEIFSRYHGHAVRIGSGDVDSFPLFVEHDALGVLTDAEGGHAATRSVDDHELAGAKTGHECPFGNRRRIAAS